MCYGYWKKNVHLKESNFSVFFRKNPFTGALQTMLSNPVYGIPSEGIPEMPANLLSRLNCMNTAMPHTI